MSPEKSPQPHQMAVEVRVLNETVYANETFAFRTIVLEEPLIGHTLAEGSQFRFRVNNQSLWIKGSNWIPAHSFPELVSERYLDRLFRSLRDTHQNMVRVWGGGQYESDTFYRLADRYGIMIWHDFMFGSALYPTDKRFLDNVAAEVEYQVIFIR